MEGTILARTATLRGCYPWNITRYSESAEAGDIAEI